MESAAKEGSTLADRRMALEASLLIHPLRARIAAELAEHPQGRAELAVTLGEPLPMVSYHLQVLKEIGR